MKACPVCGEWNEESNAYCCKCGAPLKAPYSAGAQENLTICAVQKNVENQVTINIQPIAVQGISFSVPTEFEGQFKVGENVQMTATVYPENATYKDITWSSSNSEIVSVNEKGLLTALASGSAVISAIASDGYESTIEVNVTSPLIPTILVGMATIIMIIIMLSFYIL